MTGPMCTAYKDMAKVVLTAVVLMHEIGEALADPVRSDTPLLLEIYGRTTFLEVTGSGDVHARPDMHAGTKKLMIVDQSGGASDRPLRHLDRVVLRTVDDDRKLSIDSETKQVRAGHSHSDFVLEKVESANTPEPFGIHFGDRVRIRAIDARAFLNVPSNSSLLRGAEQASATEFRIVAFDRGAVSIPTSKAAPTTAGASDRQVGVPNADAPWQPPPVTAPANTARPSRTPSPSPDKESGTGHRAEDKERPIPRSTTDAERTTPQPQVETRPVEWLAAIGTVLAGIAAVFALRRKRK